MPIRTHRTVAGEVRSHLPRRVFLPATTRTLWLPFHVLMIVTSGMAIHWVLKGGASVFLLPAFTIFIGLSFAGLAFVAHEALHGALVHNRHLRNLLGWVGFAPFCIAPGLWVAWHNRVHHQNTNVPKLDPDAYPTLEEYRADRHTRLAVNVAAPRSGRVRGLITLLVGFTLQATHMLSVARERGYMKRSEHRLALGQSFLVAALWLSLGIFVGVVPFLLIYVFPLFIANSIVMAFIITNHSLSPLKNHNDTLSTSLTVSVPAWVDFYALGFGYHVEHHLFPSMSNRHGKEVSSILSKQFPERYQIMPLLQALKLMFRSPRVYLGEDLLIDPESGEKWSTLGPDRQVQQLPAETRAGSKNSERTGRVSVFPAPPISGRSSTLPPPLHSI